MAVGVFKTLTAFLFPAPQSAIDMRAGSRQQMGRQPGQKKRSLFMILGPGRARRVIEGNQAKKSKKARAQRARKNRMRCRPDVANKGQAFGVKETRVLAIKDQRSRVKIGVAGAFTTESRNPMSTPRR